MIRDLFEALLLGTVIACVTDIYWGIIALFFWILVCQLLRHKELDSDYEHIDRDLFK